MIAMLNPSFGNVNRKREREREEQLCVKQPYAVIQALRRIHRWLRCFAFF